MYISPSLSPSLPAVQFVSMYEIGDYVYTFFREDPDETTQNVSKIFQSLKLTLKIFQVDYSNFLHFVYRSCILEFLACVR